jgi:poly-beta-hydroxyalkanoate depolymerase
VPLLPVEGAVDDVTGVGQSLGELAIEIGIVLNNEQAHASLQQWAA